MMISKQYHAACVCVCVWVVTSKNSRMHEKRLNSIKKGWKAESFSGIFPSLPHKKKKKIYRYSDDNMIINDSINIEEKKNSGVDSMNLNLLNKNSWCVYILCIHLQLLWIFWIEMKENMAIEVNWKQNATTITYIHNRYGNTCFIKSNGPRFAYTRMKQRKIKWKEK